MIFKDLFQKGELIFKLIYSIENEASFDVTYGSNNINDKNLILFALLFYARILRVCNSKQEKVDVTKNFVVWCAEFKRFDYNEQSLELFFNILCNPVYVFKLTKSKEIQFKKYQNGNYYISMGTFHVDQYSLLVYPVFKWVWDQINSDNKKILFEAFSLLSSYWSMNLIKFPDSVIISNQIINELYEKKFKD